MGGHTIPHSDTQHKQVFGVPGSIGYDGLHMKGPDGKQFLTDSILKVLVKANLAEHNQLVRNVQNNTQHEKSAKTHRISHRQKSISNYDPMELMLKRIRSFSRPQTQYSPNHLLEDDVFSNPVRRKQSLRPSVIKGTLQQTENHYFSVKIRDGRGTGKSLFFLMISCFRTPFAGFRMFFSCFLFLLGM